MSYLWTLLLAENPKHAIIIGYVDVICHTQLYLNQTHWSCENLHLMTIYIHEVALLFTTFTVVSHKRN